MELAGPALDVAEATEGRARHLETLLDALHDGVLFVRMSDRRILDANAACLRMFGYDRDELIGRSAQILHVDAEHFQRFADLVRPFMDREESAILDFVFRRKDGSTFPVQVTVSRVPGASSDGLRVVGIVRDVSATQALEAQKAEAEAQLRQTAQNLSDFVETSAIGLHWVGPDGTILWANAADHELLGYAKDEYVGRNIREFHADPETIDDILVRLGRDERLHDYPARLKAKDGSIRHVLIDSSVRWENGKFAHTRCFTRDVTLQRSLEDRERSRARELKTLVRIQEELAKTLDIERVVQAATDACTVVSGAKFGAFFYNVTDSKGERYMLYTLTGAPRDAFRNFGMPRNTPLFEPTFSGKGVVRSDDVTKDPRYGQEPPHHGMPAGHLAVRSYLAVPVVSRDGSVHGGIFLGHPEPGVFSRDAEDLIVAIAAQTAAAIDNSNLYRRVKDSEERYRKVVSNAPDQILTIDARGQILTLNRSLHAVPVDQVVGLNAFDLFSEDDRARVRRTVLGAISDKSPATCEARAQISDEERWFHVRAAALETDDEGGGAVLIVTDVTDRKRSEAELSRMRAQLIQGEKLSALGGLVSGVAHELRTPLTFLSTNVFLLKRRLENAVRRGASAAEVNAEIGKFLADVTNGVDRINQLVEDLRRYTKARHNAEIVSQPLNEIVLDAIELFRATNRHAHVLETSLSRTEKVSVNRGAIQQVTLNLLQNAAEAAPAGSRIRVTTRDDEGSVVLEVVDEGEGIAEDVRTRMYEPLFTTKPGGTGLGLSIVKRIVEDHHAAIECESAVGRGATFRVRFSRSA